MKLFNSRRRIAVIGAVTALTLAGGGAAFAYFTATGNGTGHATVGTSTTWAVTAGDATGTLLPCGADTTPSTGCTDEEATIVFTVTNNASTSQLLQTAVPVIDHNGGTPALIVTGTGDTAVTGCEASWFGASDSTFASSEVAAGASATVTVTVTMDDPTTTNQDACQGALPNVTLNVT